MKILAVVLTALIIVIQYPLWLGKGGWGRAWTVDQELQTEKDPFEEVDELAEARRRRTSA